MNTTFPFTQRRIEKLAVEDTTKTYTDQKLKNLKITVTPQGSKTFYCRFKVGGMAKNIKIGDAQLVLFR